MRALVLMLALGAATTAVAEEPLATAPAEYRELPRELRLDGHVEAVRQSTVSAQTQAEILEVLFDVHDYVERGVVLVRLRDTEQQAEVNLAEATLREARAQVDEAREHHQRIQELKGRGLASQAELDKALAALKSARARSEAAQARLAKAREQLEHTRVRAPYSGLVTERHAEPGETARPGQPLMTGLSLDELRVNVDIPQSRIQAVRASRQAQVTLPEDGSVEASRITVFPYADPASNTFRARLELPEGTPGLFPGMFVKTAFSLDGERRLLIPERAVAYRSEVSAVYVLGKGGRLGFRHVRLGRRDGNGMIAVLAGLDEGERVALDPIAAGALLREQRKGGGHE
jgi:RND family efflux transporter MFP subunit